MTKGAQLALDLPVRIADGREDFLVGPANQAAVLWIDRWPDWPLPALVLEGPAASGKTHLAHVWQRCACASLVSGRELTLARVPQLLAATKNWVVEEAEHAPEQPLLHFFNAVVEQAGALLITTNAPPARWGIKLPDLSSRLASLPVASIMPPDDGLIRAVLIKLSFDCQARVPPDVIDYLSARIERSFEAARAVMTQINAASIAEQRRITVPFVRQILAETLDRDLTEI